MILTGSWDVDVLITVFYPMLKRIENLNLTSLEEVEISSSFKICLRNIKNINQVNATITDHFKDYSPKFNVIIKISHYFLREIEKSDFYNEFKGFKMTLSKGNYQEFSKTFRVSPKVTTVFVLKGEDIIKP